MHRMHRMHHFVWAWLMSDAFMSSAAEWWLHYGDGVLSQPRLLFKEHLFATMTGKEHEQLQNFQV